MSDHGNGNSLRNMEYSRSQLEAALAAGLPGEEAHRRMLPAGREYVRFREAPAHALESGVLVLLFPMGKSIHTCLIKRPEHMKVHAGQVGFPGGRREAADAGTLETALREAHEETGVTTSEAEVLGPLTPLYVPVSGYLIFPWLAWSATMPRFTPNPGEADKILLFPLPAGRGRWPVVTTMMGINGLGEVPSLLFDGEVIWGATAMILNELAEVLARVTGKPGL